MHHCTTEATRTAELTIANDQTIDVMVSYGTWHHQGFKSRHGVQVREFVDTRQVLDAEVISKECTKCQQMDA